jgi:hypothetical protein
MLFRVTLLLCAVCVFACAQAVQEFDLLHDDFEQDTSLDQTLWATNTPLVNNLARSAIPGIAMGLVWAGLGSVSRPLQYLTLATTSSLGAQGYE